MIFRPVSSQPWWPRRDTWLALLLFTGLALLFAYPISLHPATLRFPTGPDGDLGWYLLGWDAHAFLHKPWAIFDANIYYLERLTLAYGENVIGLAIFAAPIISARPLRRIRDAGFTGLLLLAPAVLVFIPYQLVRRRAGLRRGLGTWEANYSSFIASPSHLHGRPQRAVHAGGLAADRGAAPRLRVAAPVRACGRVGARVRVDGAVRLKPDATSNRADPARAGSLLVDGVRTSARARWRRA